MDEFEVRIVKQINDYKGKRVLVLGFGISGLNAAYLLQKLGATVVANDQQVPKDPRVVAGPKKALTWW